MSNQPELLISQLSCIVPEHELTFLAIALIVCASGTFATTSLFVRSRSFDGLARIGWLLLTAICTGASTWTTHFVAMLGYRPDVPASFSAVATGASILVAILGCGFGLATAGRAPTRLRTVLGGGMLGLSIAGMHYLGMFGYRVTGLIEWSWPPVALSVVASIGLSIGALWTLRQPDSLRQHALAAAILSLAILVLHILGMAAMTVTPFNTEFAARAGDTAGVALAISVVALLVIGAGLSTCLIDMDLRIREDTSLVDLAFRDPLTGLGNRRAFQAKIDGAFAERRWFKLMLIDLDHFKSVNDTYGHATGDKLLREVSSRIQTVIGPEACAYRLGGDELAVLVFNDREAALNIAHEIVAAMREPAQMDGQHIVPGCSVGLCAVDHARDTEELIRYADAALYEAKSRGRGQVARHTPGMLEAAAQRTQMESDLQLAVERGEFQLHYQPIVDPDTAGVLGYEALLRWTNPVRGSVPPSDFIPLAERCGAIIGIGQWVLEEACRTAASWDDDLYIAVNVSPAQLRSFRFPAIVTRVLAETGLPPQRLTIELTETAIVSNGDEVAALLEAVRVLGVKVAMDDFGTGYSSLSYLRRLPVDVIKIDRSFVASAEVDPNSMAVLKAIIQMGRDMRIATVGEGVETPGQRDLLRKAGCGAAQGYLFGKPMPVASIRSKETALCA